MGRPGRGGASAGSGGLADVPWSAGAGLRAGGPLSDAGRHGGLARPRLRPDRRRARARAVLSIHWAQGVPDPAVLGQVSVSPTISHVCYGITSTLVSAVTLTSDVQRSAFQWLVVLLVISALFKGGLGSLSKRAR